MASSMSIKGTREGLTITLGDGDLASMLVDLDQHLGTQEAFFRGGAVALRVGGRSLAGEDLGRLSELFARHQMVLRTVVSADPTTATAAQALGLRTVTQALVPDGEEDSGPGQLAPPPRERGTLEGSRGTLIRHLVRSGQVVRHTGHVVVLGDVNVGGEVIAGGDILVWGGLYGTAHAGVMGDDRSVICALDLSPLQLRIGEYVARPEEEGTRKQCLPEVAYVRENRIVVEAWERVRGG